MHYFTDSARVLERSHARRGACDRLSIPGLNVTSLNYLNNEYQLPWITHFQQRKTCQNTTNIFDLRLVKSTLLDHLSIQLF